MTPLESLAQPDVALFEPFLEAAELRLSRTHATEGCRIPEGVGSLRTPTGTVEYAVCRSRRFAALRWLDPEAEVQSFFVQPEGKPAQCGIVVQPTELVEEVPSQATEWLRAALPEESLKEATKPLPRFITLVSLLASSGQLAGTDVSTAELADSRQRELEYYRELADDQGDELRKLRARIREISQLTFRKDLMADQETAASEEAEELQDLSLLPQWAEDNKERIVVLPRALNGAKKSLYLRPEMIFRALEYLAGPYREYRLGKLSKSQVEDALTKTGLHWAGSTVPSVAGEQGETYFVTYDGRRRFLEFHLLKGGGRDERYCLRVYFFWDDVSQRAVVGSLPAHLANSLS